MPTSYRGREYGPNEMEPFGGIADYQRDATGIGIYLGDRRGCRALAIFDHEDCAEVRVYDKFGTENQKYKTVFIPRGQARGWSEPLAIGENRPVAYVVIKKE